MTEVLSVGVSDLNGEKAVTLYAPPDIPEGRLKYMFLPPNGDAGHLAAMAQYLTIGPEAIVFVHESAMVALGCEVEAVFFCQAAIRRGVQADVLDDSSLLLTSKDGTSTVEIRFPAWSGELAGCEDAMQLLDMAEALYAPADLTSVNVEV
jgi:hypothetical protein